MSGLPPRPTSPGAPSSINSPHRGHRPPSPSIPHWRLPSPRLNRSRSRERANGASHYRPRSPPYSRGREPDTYFRPSDRDRARGREWDRYDRYVPSPSRWPPEADRELDMERRRRERAVEYPRYDYGRDRAPTRYGEPENHRRWRERSNSPGHREWRSNGRHNRPPTPPRRRSPDRYIPDLRSPRRHDWAHSPRRRMSPSRKSRSPRSPHREDHPEHRGEPSIRHSSRRQRSITPAQRMEPPPLSPGELEDHIESGAGTKTDNNNQAKKRELSSHPSATPPPGDSRPEVKAVSPHLAPSVQHQSPRSQTPAAKNRESLPTLPKSSMSPSASKGDEIAEEDKQGSDRNSVGDHGTEDGQKVGSLSDIPTTKRRPTLTPKLDAEIAETIAERKKAADDRARLSAEIRRAKQDLVLATLDLIFAEDRRKIAERQRVNMEKGLPLDAFDGLVRDGMIDDMGILAASTQSVAVDVVTE